MPSPHPPKNIHIIQRSAAFSPPASRPAEMESLESLGAHEPARLLFQRGVRGRGRVNATPTRALPVMVSPLSSIPYHAIIFGLLALHLKPGYRGRLITIEHSLSASWLVHHHHHRVSRTARVVSGEGSESRHQKRSSVKKGEQIEGRREEKKKKSRGGFSLPSKPLFRPTGVS